MVEEVKRDCFGRHDPNSMSCAYCATLKECKTEKWKVEASILWDYIIVTLRVVSLRTDKAGHLKKGKMSFFFSLNEQRIIHGKSEDLGQVHMGSFFFHEYFSPEETKRIKRTVKRIANKALKDFPNSIAYQKKKGRWVRIGD